MVMLSLGTDLGSVLVKVTKVGEEAKPLLASSEA